MSGGGGQVPDRGEVETFTFTINRSELIPGGNGARIGFSDEFPDKQFLFLPPQCSGCGGTGGAGHVCLRGDR